MKAAVTVACVFVEGEYPYTIEYVERLHAMVKRWIDRPFAFYCLTDRPALMPRWVNTIPINKLPGSAPWSKLELFNPAREWSGRVLYLDLDSLIVAPLAPILDVPATFAITDDPPSLAKRKNPRDKFGRLIVRRFNSSVMVWDGGSAESLYTDWTPAIADRLSGDQDHIGERLPNAATLPRAWFPRISEIQDQPIPSEAKIVLVKTPKNHLAVDRWPWVRPLWGAA